MTVKELIDRLMECPENAVVTILASYNEGGNTAGGDISNVEHETVTGSVYLIANS